MSTDLLNTALTRHAGIDVPLIGGAMYPVYSVSSSLAFDRAEGKSLVDVSTTILAIHTLGAIAGPFTVSLIGTVLGDAALYSSMIIASGVILATVLLRGRVAEPVERRTKTVGPTPKSSVEMVQAAAEVVEQQTAEENASRREDEDEADA